MARLQVAIAWALSAALGACGGGSSSTPDASGGGGSDGGGVADAGGGMLLFEEPFEDTDFTGRGWYDGPSGALSDVEHVAGSTRSFECTFGAGDTSCIGGKPARHPIPPTETVYLSFWIKFSDGWVGSGRPYHPHMLHFVTDIDGDYIGPAATHLTTYTEIVGGRPLLGLQDSLNVDPNCILRNDDSIVGCNGDFASYPFTEMRSVCSCNGLAGEVDGRDCFPSGPGWYSARIWDTDQPTFVDAPGPGYKGDWHHVEVYFQMNTIQAGAGVPDGRIRWSTDGATVISSDAILMRTAANATIRFDQFLMLPYIGDGSPVDQTFWIDDLSVWTAPP
jgi:hypothetical protein